MRLKLEIKSAISCSLPSNLIPVIWQTRFSGPPLKEDQVVISERSKHKIYPVFLTKSAIRALLPSKKPTGGIPLLAFYAIFPESVFSDDGSIFLTSASSILRFSILCTWISNPFICTVGWVPSFGMVCKQLNTIPPTVSYSTSSGNSMSSSFERVSTSIPPETRHKFSPSGSISGSSAGSNSS